MAVLTDLVSRVRLELGDMPTQFTFTATGDGTTKSFDLKVKPVENTTLLVTVAGSPITTPAGYTIQQDLGIVTFVTAPANNAAISVVGTHYRYFTDTDITRFVNTAVEQHTFERTDGYGSQMTLLLLPPVEEYPLAILSTIEALWALATDSAFDINISSPDGVMIPRSDRYRQLTQMIQARTDQTSSFLLRLTSVFGVLKWEHFAVFLA